MKMESKLHIYDCPLDLYEFIVSRLKINSGSVAWLEITTNQFWEASEVIETPQHPTTFDLQWSSSKGAPEGWVQIARHLEQCRYDLSETDFLVFHLGVKR